MKKPISIWITQFILGGMVLLDGFIFLRGFTGPEGGELGRYLLGMAILFALVSTWAVAFWGLVKRRAWGRWLGLASLIMIWAILTYSQMYPTNGPYQRYEYSNDAQRAGALSARIAIQVLFILLMLWVAFSKKVTSYFQNHVNDQASLT